MRSIQDEALNRMIFFGEKSLDLAFPLKLCQRTNMLQHAPTCNIAIFESISR